MAGTIVADTLQNGAGTSTSMDNAINGSAKAWVNFNGSTATIRTSYNVGSITKNGTGDYTVNFSNALTDANYSVVMSAGNGNAFGNFGVSTRGAGASFTASLCRINTFATNTGTATDADVVCVTVTR
jgi:hypothetical protein